MIKIKSEILSALAGEGAVLIRFVDVRGLSANQNRGLPNAIFFGLPLCPSYVRTVMETPGYVEQVITGSRVEEDEFHLTERRAGEVADRIADKLRTCGYLAYSQSDPNLMATGGWDEASSGTLLPHKTIAVLAGAGWIGKNNLLITPEYGAALCIGTILTDAPLDTSQPRVMENICGACKRCYAICPTRALAGKTWEKNISRETIIDIRKCTTCMKCLLHCPYTQKYIRQHEDNPIRISQSFPM